MPIEDSRQDARREMEREFWTARMTIYRQDERDRDATGQGYLYRLVPAGPFPAGLKATENYDDNRSPAGEVKVDNIMTADKVHFAHDTPVRARDVLRLAMPDGEVLWFTAAGEPKRRKIYSQLFVITSYPPEIGPGDWGP